MWQITQVGHSIWRFIQLVISGSLHVSTSRLGNKYRAYDSKIYTVFRETVSDERYGGREITLAVGFRLSFIGQNSFFHRLFQTLSMLNTPVWVGFLGFKTKLWLVDQKTKDYLGIYRYQGKNNAKKYAQYICAILKPVSCQSSVWYEILDESFEKYLKRIQILS